MAQRIKYLTDKLKIDFKPQYCPKIYGKAKTLQGKGNLMQFMTTSSALQKVFRVILHREEEERLFQT
jgi:hypothetical protein